MDVIEARIDELIAELGRVKEENSLLGGKHAETRR
jgi:hypothetical protein